MHGNVELKTILLIRCSLLSVKGQEVQSLEDLDEKKNTVNCKINQRG